MEPQAPTPAHEYSRGLPRHMKPWTHSRHLPGDLESVQETHKILTRHDTNAREAFATNEMINYPSATWTPRIPSLSDSDAETVNWLRHITNGHCFPAEVDLNRDPNDAPAEWQYSHRREAQNITPFLFLGPASVAKNEAWLRDNNITMVLAIREASLGPSMILEPRAAQSMGLEAVKIDFPANKVVSKFPVAIDAINTHLAIQHARQEAANQLKSGNGLDPDKSLPARILVYDLTGNDAAASVVGAFLVAIYGADARESSFIVHSKRFCIAAQILHEWMVKWVDISQAHKQVGGVLQPWGTGKIQKKEKRQLEQDNRASADTVQDTEMDGVPGQESNCDEVEDISWPPPSSPDGKGRRIQAPFADYD